MKENKLTILLITLLASLAHARAPSSAPTSAPASAPVSAPVSLPGAFCGDGTLQAGERCDDGNTKDNDGCSSRCEPAPNRRAGIAFGLTAVGTLAGVALLNSQSQAGLTGGLIAFTVGPALGHLYMGRPKPALAFTALRAGAVGLTFLGGRLAAKGFIEGNVGDFVPFNAFPGDGSVAGGVTLAGLGIVSLAGLVVYDVVRQAPRTGQVTQLQRSPTLY